ncbi:MAG: outer membrane beta-barrel protein, partial [bacterium]|nr:outer membrane beta-barrel protein [Candidatus Colisoma equi]
MKNAYSVLFVLLSSLILCLSAGAEVLDRPSGIKIGERLTLRPYVSMSLTYDSNVNGSSSSVDSDDGDFLWTISPSLFLHYNAETWSLILSGFYNYHHYFKNEFAEQNQHTFGEDLRWNWSNSTGTEKGWSL